MTEEQPVTFVIDDDATVREAVADLLRSVGLSVKAFGSTQEFLHSKRPDAPGCIVLDVRLPGASGLEFQRTLAQAGILLPVVFISGHGDISMSVRAIKSGAIEFLTNPERMTELRKALMELSPDHKTIPSYFQALITTSVENSVPGNSSLVAVRVIPN